MESVYGSKAKISRLEGILMGYRRLAQHKQVKSKSKGEENLQLREHYAASTFAILLWSLSNGWTRTLRALKVMFWLELGSLWGVEVQIRGSLVFKNIGCHNMGNMPIAWDDPPVVAGLCLIMSGIKQ